MSDLGAYEDEMGRFFGSDDELDRVFDGTAADDQTRDLALFLADVKAAATTSIPGSKAEEHIAAISAEAARLAPTRVRVTSDVVAVQPLWRRVVDKNLPRLVKVLSGVVAASMSMVGLAFAGVDLPGEAAARAFESVTGVELPNQDGEENASPSDVALAVQAVIESWGDERGCEFGQAVAAAASQGRSNPEGDACTEEEDVAEEEIDGEAEGSKATGEEASAEGRAKATEKSGGASDAGADNASTGADNASTGRSTATDKSGGASDAGADNAGSGDDAEIEEVEEEHDGEAQGSRETGDEAASEGQGNAPDEAPVP